MDAGRVPTRSSNVASTTATATGCAERLRAHHRARPGALRQRWRVSSASRVRARHLSGASPSCSTSAAACACSSPMKQHGWSLHRAHPDARAVAHAREVVGVEAVRRFQHGAGARRYDLVTIGARVADRACARPVFREESSAAPTGSGGGRRLGFGRGRVVFVEHQRTYSPVLLGAPGFVAVESASRPVDEASSLRWRFCARARALRPRRVAVGARRDRRASYAYACRRARTRPSPPTTASCPSLLVLSSMPRGRASTKCLGATSSVSFGGGWMRVILHVKST